MIYSTRSSPPSSVHLLLLHSFSFFCSSSSYPRISSPLRLLFRFLSSFSGKSRFLFAGSWLKMKISSSLVMGIFEIQRLDDLVCREEQNPLILKYQVKFVVLGLASYYKTLPKILPKSC
ncbi:hypothetical protein J1N35_019685 [Gossypium stocksii]|uniref:Uncharacterized protein n=1 Tax=Gossypium stocksii TaxID=47602 RepID=A0A9D3VDN8_9ROSI|nr:hypothetical protein J1N35_019685 [Gossypium stocksii]